LLTILKKKLETIVLYNKLSKPENLSSESQTSVECTKCTES